ncbi:MAG: [protein-PII] uridylyltransferase [Deltaproteobacteria bacterium]|nr:[protein-PII] uridylyltransferase [Deltaproteobacteria bacterium]
MGEPLRLNKADHGVLAVRIKGYFKEHEEELRKRLHLPSPGLEITRAYTLLTDDILFALFKTVSEDIPISDEIALVALGGYGRSELNIRSDIDLMLLYKKRITPGIEELTQKILYILWDAGRDVGFSLRSVAECVTLAKQDSKTMTSLLDVRYLLGSRELFSALVSTVKRNLFTGRARRNFIEEKLEERQSRHEKYGGSVYILEPNVKDGEGGLRDIHTSAWVVRAKEEGRFEPVGQGLLTEEEEKGLAGSTDFLHWVRNELHFETGRKKDQLAFDSQENIARLLGFRATEHELAVEAFMQTYYRHASNIKGLTSLIISRCLRRKDSAFTFMRRRSKVDGRFAVEGGLLKVETGDVFTKDPASIIKAFEYSQAYGADISHSAKDLILKSLPGIDDGVRSSQSAAASFMNILRGERVYETLSEMHGMRVLERYIPEFGAISCRVQHDLYHIYTVDAHSLFAIRELERLKSSYKSEFPLLSTIMEEAENPETLYLAVLLHDIGKSLGKGHAEKGANLVPAICARLNISEDAQNLVTFLVRNHLLLADTAQYRDMHDERLVIEFAKKIGEAERLKLLYLLTFADVRAVGPEVWNQWKGALFRELFFSALTVLERGSFEVEDAGAKIERTKGKVKELLRVEDADKGEEAVENYFRLLPNRYYLVTSPESIAAHIKIARALGGAAFVMNVEQVPERDYTEIVVCTHDIHGLFAMITGVMTANSVNILGAQINTLRNGIALDILQVTTALGELLTDGLKTKKIEKDLNGVISGKVRVESLVGKVRPSILDKKVKPTVPTRIEIDNEVSDTFTVLDIHTQDRLGLLYRISSTIMNLGLYIHIAKIATKGDEAADIFYIKDIFGQKIYNPGLLKKIEASLASALA